VSLDSRDRICGLDTLTGAEREEATFLSNLKYKNDLGKTKAKYCLVNRNHVQYIPPEVIPIIVGNVQHAYAILLNHLYSVPQFLVEPGVAAEAWVDPRAKIGSGTEIQCGARIGDGVVIGNNCKICANVVINHGCQIGDRTYIGANSSVSYAKIGADVIIQNGVNIGQCGFGFYHHAGFNYKIPQLGLVIIGNDVEIGSGTCIDRGALEDTVIGDNSKLDNLVHIGHGVSVGSGCFITAQAGISGSVKIGNYVQIAGKAAIAGHLTIGNGVKIAACSGVTKNLGDGATVGGFPAMPIEDWRRTTVAVKKLIKR
jgi:UDP-3-O-[3-hydroxymyristoyl] glucosamine N-acyltransferase